jgi:hypothetical protein
MVSVTNPHGRNLGFLDRTTTTTTTTTNNNNNNTTTNNNNESYTCIYRYDYEIISYDKHNYDNNINVMQASNISMGEEG